MPAAFPWAEALNPAERERVEAEIFTRHVKKGEYVSRRGDPVKHWIGVVEGLVKLGIGDRSGKVTTYIAFAPGGWFGEASLQRQQPLRGYDAVALRDSVLAMVPDSTFLWMQNNNIHFKNFLLRLMAERIFYFFAVLEYDRLLHGSDRVAHRLAALFNLWLHPGIGPEIHISQEELGNLVGISRQEVNQALKTLKEAGLLQVEHGSIKVLDLNGLVRYQETGIAPSDTESKSAARNRTPG